MSLAPLWCWWLSEKYANVPLAPTETMLCIAHKNRTSVLLYYTRLIQVDNQLHIIQTEVSVNPEEEVMLCDKEGNVGKFLPMAIIHHSGNVHHQTTQGHFRADVKNKETGKWFRTSDNDQPKELAKGGLTKKGYIFLYKRNF